VGADLPAARSTPQHERRRAGKRHAHPADPGTARRWLTGIIESGRGYEALNEPPPVLVELGTRSGSGSRWGCPVAASSISTPGTSLRITARSMTVVRASRRGCMINRSAPLTGSVKR
jgi:hypothetical protein